MRQSVYIGLAALGLALGSASSASSRAWDTLTLDCKLTPAAVLTAWKGQVTPQELKPDNPDDTMLVTFTGFDEKSGRATMVGNAGSSPVFFSDEMGHLQIIQITDTKNVATTTITIDGQDVRALHTRHMWLVDSGVLSVYAGPCRMR
jgi:hypothetical protein